MKCPCLNRVPSVVDRVSRLSTNLQFHYRTNCCLPGSYPASTASFESLHRQWVRFLSLHTAFFSSAPLVFGCLRQPFGELYPTPPSGFRRLRSPIWPFLPLGCFFWYFLVFDINCPYFTVTYAVGYPPPDGTMSLALYHLRSDIQQAVLPCRISILMQLYSLRCRCCSRIAHSRQRLVRRLRYRSRFSIGETGVLFRYGVCHGE